MSDTPSDQSPLGAPPPGGERPRKDTARKAHPGGDRHEQVYSITSASSSHSDELGAREIRYALSMGVRTLCFVGGVLLWNHVMWLAVVLFFGAVFLPYTSVILANAGVRTKADGSDLMKPTPFGELDDGTKRG